MTPPRKAKPPKKRQPHPPAHRAAIASGARAAVAAGHWPAPGPLWTAAEDALLGTMPDAAVSARTGRTLGSIAARRHKLGIPSQNKAGRPAGWRKQAAQSNSKSTP